MTPGFRVRAAILVVLGAVLGGVLWILIAIAADLERAVPALLVGVLAGAAPRIEPHRNRSTRVIALLATLVGMAIVQYFVVRHSIVTGLVDAGGDRSLPMFLSPASMWFVTFGWLRVYPIDGIFWAISAMAAILLPHRQAAATISLDSPSLTGCSQVRSNPRPPPIPATSGS